MKRKERTAECPVDSQGVSARREWTEWAQNSSPQDKPNDLKNSKLLEEQNKDSAKVQKVQGKIKV